jgi:hypothetical protein
VKRLNRSALAVASALVLVASAPIASAGFEAPARFDARAYLKTHGYLPLRGVATLENAKAHAAAFAPRDPTTDPALPATAPTVGSSWQGTASSAVSPPDANGAIGPSSYIEVVNQRIAIYKRGGRRIAGAPFGRLTGNGNATDPMILWDPDTQRFYYNVLNVSNARMDWGFSKTASPTSIPGCFCHYETGFGYSPASIPDYPKLGQTKDYLLIGDNFYPTANSDAATSADLLWITKPQGSGEVTTCPAGSSFDSGKVADLRNADDSQTFTPIPAIQTDPSGAGYVVSMSDIECPPTCGTGTTITVFSVTDAGGVPSVSEPTSMTVGSYQSPPNAPQPGTANRLDTLDGRLTHAVSGYDPTFATTTVWVAHAVKGGAGSKIRWYEIDPVLGTLVQSGAVSSHSQYVFDPGISNDRTCTASECAHGAAMVLGFTTSSSTRYPAVRMVSKVGTAAQSGSVLVKISSVSDTGFTCSPCRWGDYGGATPDPAASLTGSTGAVWLSNQWTNGGSAFSSGDRTWNWQAHP